MGLNIGKFCAEQFFSTLDTQSLHLVHELTAAVVALTGQTLGILIGEHRAHGSNHSGRSKVLRCDELQTVLLTGELPVHHSTQLGIELGHKAD